MSNIRVDLHETIGVLQISVDGEVLFVPRAQTTELLAAILRAVGDSIPEPEFGEADVIPIDSYSRKVSDG